MSRYDWKGKKVLVTGASTGIGAVFARELAKRGAHLVLVARSDAKLRALAKEVGNAEVIACDLSQRGAAEKLRAAAPDIDVLVNNAGFGKFGAFEEMPADELQEMVDLNVSALTALAHAFMPVIAHRKGGIINVASTAAFQPVPHMAVYAATKAYVLSLSEALWGEYREQGVRVLALCPGATETPFFERSGEAAALGKKANPVDVVKDGLLAFEAGRSTFIAGAKNWFLANISRFAPRETVTKLSANMMKPRAPLALSS